MFSLHIERCTFFGIDISFLPALSVCGTLFVVMRYCMLAHCNDVSFVLSSLCTTLKMSLY